MARAEAALREALAASSPGELVVLNSACGPDVTGEDLSYLAQSYHGNGRILYMPSAGQEPASAMFREFLRWEEQEGGPIPRRNPRSVCLVGYPGGRARQELASLLEAAGFVVEACLLPSLSVEALRRARRAAVLILSRDGQFETAAREVAERLCARTVRPPAPYGLAGTQAWLREVASAMGAQAVWEAAWSRRVEAWAGRWSELKSEAAGYRLAFILQPSQMARLSDPAYNAGVPLLPVVKEMGFGIELLVYVDSSVSLPKEVEGRSGPDGRHRLSWFRTREELEGLLRSRDFQAVYSDFFFDSRLTRSGKGQFSLASFEAGLEGALRSLDRLLGICRLPFYRRYARYLGGPGSRSR